jgi:hypothetical protein
MFLLGTNSLPSKCISPLFIGDKPEMNLGLFGSFVG